MSRARLASFAAFAALGCALASCAAIGGLDEFRSVDCVGASCDGGAPNGQDAGGDTTADTDAQPAGDAEPRGDGEAGGASSFSVGGSVVGLNGAVGLQLTNNGGDVLTIPSAGGAFAFNTKLPSGAPFDVAVKTQPTGTTCQVSGGSGTVGAANVTSVVVNCAPGTFTVGGSVSGLAAGGTLVVQNNAGPGLTITTNGSFTFLQTLTPSSTYSVAVKTQPSGQTCKVSNGTGTMTSANVTNVLVSCSGGATGILCSGGAYCSGSNVCCWETSLGTASCVTTCANSRVACDDAVDCGGGYCCAKFKSSGDLNESFCVAAVTDCTPASGGSTEFWCDPTAAAPGCPQAQTCTGTSALSVYKKCK